jgi:alkyl sulfatase BDS1-like metallo-beta-lactamase superfamily hydrolase
MPVSSFGKLSTAALVVGISISSAWAQDTDDRKDATEATRQSNAALLGQLPFDDTTDFDDAKRGLVAPLPTETVETADGAPVWDPAGTPSSPRGRQRPMLSTRASGDSLS